MPPSLRVGAVNYLNTKPLIERLTGFAPNIELSLDLPSRLADQLAAGELDVGLIPVVEYFRGDGYTFVPNVAIGSRGPVLSVTLFSKVPWEDVRTVALDEGSRTSAALTQIILRKRYGVQPEVYPLAIDTPAENLTADAVLLIGDRAMRACPATDSHMTWVKSGPRGPACRWCSRSGRFAAVSNSARPPRPFRRRRSMG